MAHTCEKKLASLEKEIIDLKTRLLALESINEELVFKIDKLQSHQNRKKVLVNGLPHSASLKADPVKAVLDLLNDDLNIDISSSDIGECFLLKNKNTSGTATSNSQIQIDFKNLDLKQKVMKTFIERMRNGNGILKNGNRIYLNNKLPSTQYKLFGICKRMRKAGKISSAYNRGDAVFVKISPDSTPLRIRYYKCVENLARQIGFSLDGKKADKKNRNGTRSETTQTAMSAHQQQVSSSSTATSSSMKNRGVTTRRNAKHK